MLEWGGGAPVPELGTYTASAVVRTGIIGRSGVRVQHCWRGLITGARSRLDTKCAEMALFLNGRKEIVPHEMTRLTTEQATEAMSRWLTSTCAENDRLSAGVRCEIGVPGLDDSGVEPQD